MNQPGAQRGLTAVEVAVLIVLAVIVAALFFGKQAAQWKPAQACAESGSVCFQGAASGSGKDCCVGLSCSEDGASPGTFHCVPG